MPINIIAALANNNCIGKNGELPWHIPEDLKRFKELTLGKTVIMGRKTWESLPERFRPLPNRRNIVITRQANYPVPQGVILFSSLDEALTTEQDNDIFVIGGAEIYSQALPFADKLYLTRVNQFVDGDVFFPALEPLDWKEMEHVKHPGYTFITYEKKHV